MKATQPKLRIADISYIGIFAAIIAACSWISIPTAIPFTLQTFGVFAALAMLGGKRGFFAILTYLLAGAVGLPVFAGWKGGLTVFVGNTGGYLIGFLLLGAVYWLITACVNEKPFTKVLALVIGLLLCYAFGTAWFFYLSAKTGEAVSFLNVLGWCVFPFLLPDAIKLALAMVLSAKLSKYIV